MKKSKCLIASSILGVLYTIYLISYFGGAIGEDAIAGSLATALVTPHMLLIALATIFVIIATFTNKAGFALTAGILYACGGVIFLLYIIFVIPMIVLSFVGYAKVKKYNKNIKVEESKNQ